MLKIKSMDLGKEKVATLIIPVCEEFSLYEDRRISALVKNALKMEEFSGEKSQKIIFYNPRGIQADRVMLIGMGKKEALDRETLRSAAGQAVQTALAGRLTRVHFSVPSEKKAGMRLGDMLEALMEGASLGNYILGTYKQDKKKHPLKEITMLVAPEQKKTVSTLPRRITAVCDGTLLARKWANMPANLLSPAKFADDIVRHADRVGLKATVLDDKVLRRKKFGAMLAVASGSDNKPRLAVLEYVPRKAQKTIALVGKGVTFDSGGINLKPGAGMDTMKTDMAGAAAVASTMITVARLKPNFRVVGLMPLVENMPSGKALRPGDIITAYNGKTVEVGNTDAEGRLILADAMAYAVKTYKPDFLLDVATLTGACVMALGEKIAGVFSRNETLAQSILDAGEKTFERCWRLPLPDDYKELMKSDLADINNMSSTRYGGAITAALFLSEFAENVPWAHIDIAGPARNGKTTDYCPKGGSGFGVRLLWEVLCNL